jgi:hypothetical protein
LLSHLKITLLPLLQILQTSVGQTHKVALIKVPLQPLIQTKQYPDMRQINVLFAQLLDKELEHIFFLLLLLLSFFFAFFLSLSLLT